MSETKREYAANYRKPPLHTASGRVSSGNPRGRPKKTRPALLLALNEPVFVTIDGERRKITKCEVIATQMVKRSPPAWLFPCQVRLLACYAASRQSVVTTRT